jgi:hypothetical protein
MSPLPSAVTLTYRSGVLVLLYVDSAMIAWTGAWLVISAVHAQHSHFGQPRRLSIADEVEVWLK